VPLPTIEDYLSMLNNSIQSNLLSVGISLG
jgi:hypothetical protein